MKRTAFLKSLKEIKKALLTQKKPTCPTVPLSSENATEALCTCQDAKGDSKNLYLSYKEAEEVRNYLYETNRLFLSIYACPNGFGWHLTKG